MLRKILTLVLVANVPAGSGLAVEPLALINCFGRIADHKALGFTSSFGAYVDAPLALWLPCKQSRRLCVERPDWKDLFGEEESAVLDQRSFARAVLARPFRFPHECPVPASALALLDRDDASVLARAEALSDPALEPGSVSFRLKDDAELLRRLNAAFDTETAREVLQQNIPAMFSALSNGNGELTATALEKTVLTWGRDSCPDDPVLDWDAWAGRVGRF